eukprot:scaffold19709_cov78-Skeletonema_dohrnii-CCMP3373.AAC.4
MRCELCIKTPRANARVRPVYMDRPGILCKVCRDRDRERDTLWSVCVSQLIWLGVFDGHHFSSV